MGLIVMIGVNTPHFFEAFHGQDLTLKGVGSLCRPGHEMGQFVLLYLWIAIFLTFA